MEKFLDFITNMNDHVSFFVNHYGALSYLIFSLIIFGETAFVITAFLPGDSLIFATTAFVVGTKVNVLLLLPCFILAAFLGDSLNFYIGKKLGSKIFQKKNKKIIKESKITKIQDFINGYGNKSIIIARFVPMFRSLVPFIQGSSNFQYKQFAKFSILGVSIWSSFWTLVGYIAGNIPAVKKDSKYILIGVIVIIIIPIIITIVMKLKNKSSK